MDTLLAEARNQMDDAYWAFGTDAYEVWGHLIDAIETADSLEAVLAFAADYGQSLTLMDDKDRAAELTEVLAEAVAFIRNQGNKEEP
jgi:HKD family nuclease